MYATLIVWLSAAALAAEPVAIAEGRQPQAAIAANGTLHLVYGVGEAVFHIYSSDGGQRSFSAPREAFRVTNMSLGMRRGPRLAISGKTLVVSAIGGAQGKGRDGDLQSWRSTDGGVTWQGPVRVNDVADAAREGLHAMAAGPDGTVWCVWLDLRVKGTQVYASQSTDGGATWQPNVRVYQSPDGHVCECCHPSVLVTSDAVHVMFRNALDGNRDMYLTTSKDAGKTFETAKQLGLGNWKLNACPMDGGMLAEGAYGTLHTVWRRNGEVFTARDGGFKEMLLGRGEQPWIAAGVPGPFIVWTEKRDGILWAKLPGVDQPQKLSDSARDPIVAAKYGGPVVVCWESKRDGQPVVMMTHLNAWPRSTR